MYGLAKMRLVFQGRQGGVIEGQACEVKVGLKTKAELAVQRARVQLAGQGTRVELMEQETTKVRHQVQETTKEEQIDPKTIKLEQVN